MEKRYILLIVSVLSIAACSSKYGISSQELPRIVEPHATLKVESVSGSSVSAQSITIGAMYLESQMQPLKVDNVFLQASDVSTRDSNIYVAYSSVDAGSIPVKKGAIEHVQAYACNIGLLYASFCLKVVSEMQFTNADIFATHSDGTSLYAVGSTSDESSSPSYARLYKVTLDSASKLKTLAGNVVLPSYAGTGVRSLGSSVLVTYGTSTDDAKKGGFSVINPTTLAITATQKTYDARSVAIASNSSSTVFVTRGRSSDSSTAGTVVEYNTNGSGSALRTIASGGNTIPESKSSIEVGNELLLVSLGDQGFKVLCKSTGATLLSKPAVTVTGIPAARTVTNSVVAAPGYLFSANGEAGLYVYKFEKTNVLNSTYCQGVKATLLGRLALDSDDNDKTYIDGEISANSVRYQVVNGVTKLLTVASGNSGISLINITSLTLGLSDVDDF